MAFTVRNSCKVLFVNSINTWCVPRILASKRCTAYQNEKDAFRAPSSQVSTALVILPIAFRCRLKKGRRIFAAPSRVHTRKQYPLSPSTAPRLAKSPVETAWLNVSQAGRGRTWKPRKRPTPKRGLRGPGTNGEKKVKVTATLGSIFKARLVKKWPVKKRASHKQFLS